VPRVWPGIEARKDQPDARQAEAEGNDGGRHPCATQGQYRKGEADPRQASACARDQDTDVEDGGMGGRCTAQLTQVLSGVVEARPGQGSQADAGVGEDRRCNPEPQEEAAAAEPGQGVRGPGRRPQRGRRGPVRRTIS
jgi:hypothetical protein